MSGIKRIKSFLFDEERKTIATLEGRLSDIDQRAIDIAEALPQSLIYSETDEDHRRRLVDALKSPVGACIRESMKADPERFADALFPVLGPTIRKAVSEGMRALAERINRTAEHSFSRRGLAWRWESVRTGTPLSDIILRDTLIYRVEQIFVVQQPSGRLLAHVQNEDLLSVQDSDAVSAMLSAIEDFVSDSFGAYGQSDLNTVQIGGRTVWVLHGPHAMLAAVFFGVPHSRLRDEFHAANEEIHRRFDELLSTAVPENFRHQSSQLGELLKPLLSSDSHYGRAEEEKRLFKVPKGLRLFMMLLIVMLAWYWFQESRFNTRIGQLAAHLSVTPGIVLINQGESDGVYRFRLLKDPSVNHPKNLLATYKLDPRAVRFEISSFQSSEPEIIVSRIRGAIGVPEDIGLAIKGQTLVVSGTASIEWADQLKTLPLNWLGIARTDFSGLTSSK